jgi:hypothetical protein
MNSQKKKGVTAISDIGVAPGISNVLIGHVDHLLDKTLKAVIYFGRLPKIRKWPWEYKAVFSPIDVIEEYTRPALIKRRLSIKNTCPSQIGLLLCRINTLVIKASRCQARIRFFFYGLICSQAPIRIKVAQEG